MIEAAAIPLGLLAGGAQAQDTAEALIFDLWSEFSTICAPRLTTPVAMVAARSTLPLVEQDMTPRAARRGGAMRQVFGIAAIRGLVSGRCAER